MASQTIEDTVRKLTCDELADTLRKLIPDERYKSDLQKLIEGKVDGDLFLTLLDDPDLMNDLDLSPGAKAKIRGIIRKIHDGSLEFGQADKRKLLEPDMPWCSTHALADMGNGSGNGTASIDSGMQKAWMPRDAVWPWKDNKEIYVEFWNVHLLTESKWTIGDGQPMNTLAILHYANTWSDMGGGKIPRFVEATGGKTAQIRVRFNDEGIRNSHLGKKAQSILAPEPTMNLDLHTDCCDQYKKHVIIHEFGHALGLGHEHQRSIFWSCIEPFTNIEKMKEDLKVTDEQFAIDWKEIDDTEEGHHTPDYDPDSIMHYWFKVEWLTKGYSVKNKVEKDRKNGILSAKVAAALLGVHKRREVLADKPSDMDIQLLKRVYGDDEASGGGTNGGVLELPKYEEGGSKPKSGVPSRAPGTRTDTDAGDITTETEAVSGADSAYSDVDSTTILEVKDKGDVINEISDLIPRYFQLGTQLEVPDSELQKLQGQYPTNFDQAFNDMIRAWLKGSSTHTWQALVRAVASPTGGNDHALAQKIAARHKAGTGTVKPSAPSAPGQANGHNEGRDRLRIESDLNDVKDMLWNVRHKWKEIGGNLGVDAGSIASTAIVCRDNPDDCLRNVISTWLRMGTTDEKPITWAGLVTALEKPSLRQECGVIVEEIREKYNV